jgi:hypothetical protein
MELSDKKDRKFNSVADGIDSAKASYFCSFLALIPILVGFVGLTNTSSFRYRIDLDACHDLAWLVVPLAILSAIIALFKSRWRVEWIALFMRIAIPSLWILLSQIIHGSRLGNIH